MVARALTPSQWRALPKNERIEMLAFQKRQDDRRDELRAQILSRLPNEFGMLAQVMLLIRD